MKHTVSIIIPNFNKGRFLNQCIDSVINQTFHDWFLFIIDDCSSDHSREILSNYSENKKIKIFRLKKNKGPSFCRNLGIRFSSSKYIAFLDADDYWQQEKLMDQINFMENNNYSFTYSDYFTFRENNEKNISNKTNIRTNFTFNKFILNSSINTSTLIIKKDMIKTTKFKNLKLLEDYIFKCDILKKGIIAYKIDKCDVAYRLIPNARSANKFNNLKILWEVNKKYNHLSFFKNLLSLISITLNSFKKYGLKKY